MSSALLVLLLALAAAAPAPPGSAAPDAAASSPARAAPPHAQLKGTQCAACHSPAGWQRVTFDHLARSGFALEGRHQALRCSGCHASQDFSAPLPRACTGCHQDAHTQTLGNRCERCHDARSWESRFGPDAHVATNFPLTGRHAAMPCEECHLDVRDRTFTRRALDCVGCHQADFARTAGGSFDHAAAGFGPDCKSCHSPTSFRAARFAAHEACFEISAGPHAGIACLSCHTSLGSLAASGSCSTQTASCTRCHSCGSTDRRHAQVSGYQCKDRKCYECHRFTAAGNLRPNPGPRGLR